MDDQKMYQKWKPYTTSIQLMDMTNMMTNQHTQNWGRVPETPTNRW